MTTNSTTKKHKSICVGFNKTDYEKLAKLATLLNRSKNQTIRLAIDKWLNEYEPEAEKQTP